MFWYVLINNGLCKFDRGLQSGLLRSRLEGHDL